MPSVQHTNVQTNKEKSQLKYVLSTFSVSCVRVLALSHDGSVAGNIDNLNSCLAMTFKIKDALNAYDLLNGIWKSEDISIWNKIISKKNLNSNTSISTT